MLFFLNNNEGALLHEILYHISSMFDERQENIMKNKSREFVRDLGGGFAMGAASIIPGGSSGTMATMLGVYDRHLGHMDGLKKHLWHNLKALLPIILGFLIGFIPCMWLALSAVKYFLFGFSCLSCGVIMGGFPLLTENIRGIRPKKSYIIVLIVCAVVAAAIGITSGIMNQLGKGSLNDIIYSAMNIDPVSQTWIAGGHVQWWFYLTLIPVGIISTISMILPGVSGSMLLLIFGYYDTLLSTLHVWSDVLKGQGSWDAVLYVGGIYIIFAISMLIGFFTTVKLFKYALEKSRSLTYYGIIGFVAGSIISLFYNAETVSYYMNWTGNVVPWQVELSVGLVVLVVTTGLMYFLSTRSIKKNRLAKEEENIDI